MTGKFISTLSGLLTFVCCAFVLAAFADSKYQGGGGIYDRETGKSLLRNVWSVEYLNRSRAVFSPHAVPLNFTTGMASVCVEDSDPGEMVCCTNDNEANDNPGCSCLGKKMCAKLKADCEGTWEDDVPGVIGHCFEN